MLSLLPGKRLICLLITLFVCVQLAGMMHVTSHLLGHDGADDEVIATQHVPPTSPVVSGNLLKVADLVCAVCRAQADFVATLPPSSPPTPGCTADFVQQAHYVAYSDCIFALRARARSPPISRV